MAAPPPLRADEVLRVLRVLAPVTADPSVVLVGGQAVDFWARFLGLDTADSSAELLASKDIDFEGSAGAARAAADLLGGRSRIPSFDHHTPITGVVFFDDSDGIERRIDFLVSPLGLDGGDVRDTAVNVEIGADAPRDSLGDASGTCHGKPDRDVQILGIDDAHALAQLRTSIAIAREWSRFLLADGSISEPDRVRGVLRLNERIFRKCVRDVHFRQLFADRGIDPFDAVLVDDDRLPSAFRERRYSQMREQLSRIRRT
jgi:hypothetical protein